MPDSSRPLRILVYSDNASTREQVQLALGKRVHPDLPELSYLEVATAPMVIAQIDAGGIDLAILDGEATPAGGMGIAKQLKDEIDELPADPGADRAPGRRLAGELVTRRGRGSAPDRPDPAGRGRGVAAARTRAVDQHAIPLWPLRSSRHDKAGGRTSSNCDPNPKMWRAIRKHR